MAEIEYDRDNQNQFIIFKGQKEHSDETIKEIQMYIEENVEQKLSVDVLAKKFVNYLRNSIDLFLN